MQTAMPMLYLLRKGFVTGAALALVMLLAGPVREAAAEPPVASFLWFPSAPMTGEPVSLASTSTDPSSAITSLGWDLTGDGAFQEAGPVISTTFATPGSHLVRLRVTNAEGSSSIAAETIKVSAAPLIVMEPFPIVRFVADDDGFGTKFLLLSVEAPPGTEITISCRRRGCPVKSERKVAASTGVGTVTVGFPRFERVLPAGLILEIRVSAYGEIGEYTRLVIRHRSPPKRLDECLAPTGTTPIVCPS
jgi:PKD repeat protein